MTTSKSKHRSPKCPSRNLEKCVTDVRTLYKEYTHGTFSRAEIGSALGVSSESGPFASRLSSIKEFGLLDPSGKDYKVSTSFMTLNKSGANSPEFKSAALAAVRKAPVFDQILTEFPSKLPGIQTLATRLETGKGFSEAAAKQAATVLEESLRYAKVLDASNNILPVRGSASSGPKDEEYGSDETPDEEARQDRTPKRPAGSLQIEIALSEDRKAVVHYPPDLTSTEAARVAKVLSAIVD